MHIHTYIHILALSVCDCCCRAKCIWLLIWGLYAADHVVLGVLNSSTGNNFCVCMYVCAYNSVLIWVNRCIFTLVVEILLLYCFSSNKELRLVAICLPGSLYCCKYFLQCIFLCLRVQCCQSLLFMCCCYCCCGVVFFSTDNVSNNQLNCI